ncbi:flagellar hook protein FlgE [Colwellia sp. 4_MG-2023]|uniref:flagellar hook protein FlgE n=1 Tax=unclassified Colwellia TaxID=196834 RepID=UPI0026E1A203|nr:MULTISPECIES: flagellar hook protein FlgE [unclassified Colwellia]MDO6489387.1 flagellar hook protein FlgE [Colwellia sp. 6_MG-2023]MDO6506977.1 flagellar hook protein FlgE [Colwellia sp. 5_MG-2023]MDO6557173.1 flagellar hook protein FlgE [Colwellia sp. 4_MG-2023]
MSFNIALSGLNAAQKDLDVTSNNIANVNTTGFKESRAEFVDVYATSLLSSSKTKVGDGVLTSEVAQQFSQGSIAFTTNSLDLAITGNGFFATVPDIGSLETSYTRAGEYKLNKSNFVVNSAGEYLLAFDVNSDGSSSSVALSTASPLQIPTSSGAPTPTSEVDIKMNLPASAEIITAPFDINDSSTFSESTASNIFDSLGQSHIVTYYFAKTADNTWDMYTAVDGDLVDIPGGPVNNGAGINGAQLVFNSSGGFTSQDPALIETAALGGAILNNGADPLQQIIIDFNLGVSGEEPTQWTGEFSLNGLEDDGLAVGRLTGIEIGTDGLVEATYSNGTAEALARIALVSFANEQGLTQIGGTSWKESITSGDPIAGEAGSGTFGEINSSALEQSNVNLTTELIDLISAQRNFQANSRSLEVDNDLNNTILQIR